MIKSTSIFMYIYIYIYILARAIKEIMGNLWKTVTGSGSLLKFRGKRGENGGSYQK